MNEFRRHTDASISCCCMVQARKYIYLRICSLIFDTVDDCSRTGCGLETDRAWLTVSVSVCVRVRSSFPPSLSETERKGTQIKAVYFLLRERERKKENELHYSVLLYCPPPIPSSPPECQAHEWLRGGGGGRGKMGGTVMFCVWTPLVSVPRARLCALAWGLFQFPYSTTDAQVSTDVETVGPNSVYVLGYKRDFK